ncbi:mechanosensitive ion channel protein MscS, partial [Halorubrum sp. E3]
ALIVAAVVGVRLLTGWLKRRNGELSSKRRLLLSVAVAGATAVGALSLLAVWDRSGALLNAYESAAIADQLSNVVLAVVLLASAYAVTDFLGGVIREISAESTALSDHQEEVIRRLTQLSVYTFALLVVVGLFTDNVGGLLVGAGFLGIVVGMAARQTLGAILAGFVL